MKRWYVVAFNGKFEVSKQEALRVLKRDTRNSYSWKKENCEVLVWDAHEYVPTKEGKK
jgi:hypothetical protein